MRKEFIAMMIERDTSTPGPRPSVHVSIVVYNTWDDAARCVQSIVAQDFPGDVTVSVWNNGGPDDAARRVIALGASVHGSGTNLGFGAGHNRLLFARESDFCLILNPDVVLPPDFLTNAIEESHRLAPLAALAPQLMSESGVVERSVRRFPSLSSEFSRGLGLDRYTRWSTVLKGWKHDEVRRVDQPPGAALLMSRADFLRLGGFDETFPLYFEDVDLCRRITREIGPIYYSPRVVAQHAREGTARRYRAKTTFWIEWSRRHYIQKHFPAGARELALGCALLGVVLRALAHRTLTIGRRAPDNRARAEGYALAARAYVSRKPPSYWKDRMLVDGWTPDAAK